MLYPVFGTGFNRSSTKLRIRADDRLFVRRSKVTRQVFERGDGVLNVFRMHAFGHLPVIDR